jgi:serine/threonine-protein kinase HipA
MRAAKVIMHRTWAGILEENDEGYHFQYLPAYLQESSAEAVSLTLPLQKEAFMASQLFPFFDGLIPEGWLLDITQKNWKLNPRDRMGILLVACRDSIGAVSIEPMEKGEEDE